MNEPHVKYERRDISARYVVKFAGVIVVLAILMHVALQGLTAVLARMDGVSERPNGSSAYRPPEPRLQENEAADLAALRREEASRLNDYGWIDRKEQRVHIPIDRAMESIVQNGVPDWSEKSEKTAEPETSK